MNNLKLWDEAVRAWRAMRAQRPLGPFYRYPVVPFPSDLAIPPKRYASTGDTPLAFWTLDSVARGA